MVNGLNLQKKHQLIPLEQKFKRKKLQKLLQNIPIGVVNQRLNQVLKKVVKLKLQQNLNLTNQQLVPIKNILIRKL